MNIKFFFFIVLISVCLTSVVLAAPFVPLEWQTLVKSGPLAGQIKHAGWIRDQNGDFIDDAFDELSPDDTTQVIVQLSECLCPENLNKKFGTYGTVVSAGVLVAYVILDDVPVRKLHDLACEPFVAALERPGEGRFDLNVSTRTVRARASNAFKGQAFADLGLGDGSSIIIGIVDSGVDNMHDAFKGKFVGGFNALNWSDKNHNGIDDSCEGGDTGICEPGDGTTDPDDQDGHGTHVAGIAMGLGIGTSGDGRVPKPIGSEDWSKNNSEGMAPGAKLLDVKIGSSEKIYFDALTYALEWLFRDGRADIVNISGGVGAMYNSNGTDVISQLINGLVASGMHVVVSAGNDGENRFKSTAASELAITVANVYDQDTVVWDKIDVYGQDQIHSQSNWGPRVDFNLNNLTVGMLKPDVAAPGTWIESAEYKTKNKYDRMTGTSMATPHVSGAIALLLGMKKEVPPGAMKELLKRTAHYPKNITQSYPSIPQYNKKWGYGMIDVYKAATSLQKGITDISFTAATGQHPQYPKVRRCLISGGRKSYENDSDIRIKDKSGKEITPIQGQECMIEIQVENRGNIAAQNVVVCMGVKELGVGLQKFYKIGCKEIGSISAKGATGAKKTMSFKWTPRKSTITGAKTHDCIQATIDYPFDTKFWNNLTQRNINPIWSSSPSQGVFHVENPLKEPATIILEVKPDAMAQRTYTFELEQDKFELRPQDCPVLNTIIFFPKGPQPIGQTATFDIAAQAFSESNEDGIELSGVVFKVTTVEPALESAYACASHGPEGMVDLSLSLSGPATSDPRREVNLVKASFNVPVRPYRDTPLEDAIVIESANGDPIPSFDAWFVGEGNFVTDMQIEFHEPLANANLYTFKFGDGFVDLDGDPLTGDSDFQLRVLQGDADNNGTVTETDILFVRDRINLTVEFGSTTRADVNQDGVISDDDIRFILEIKESIK